VSEQGAVEEGQRGPSGDAEAEQGGRVGQVEESGGGDVGAEGGEQGDQEPAPSQPGRAVRAEPSPGGDQEQVHRDRVGPGLPPALSGSGGEIVQVGEGQGSGDDGLDQDRIDTQGGASHQKPSPG
jgi:hypothetical protein